MPAYDASQYEPLAPVARVMLRAPGTGAAEDDVPMLIDSGADVTLVPQASVARLGVTPEPGSYYELSGFDGAKSLAPVVRLEIVFCRRVFRGQFLLIDEPCGVLGRNVLNAVPLLLDGPRLVWDEHAASRPATSSP